MSVIRGGKYLLKTKAGRKLLSKAQKLINKKKLAKEYRKQFKSVKPYNIHTTSGVKYNFKQKPTTRSGIEIKTQRGTHYGIRGIVHKMHPKGAGAVIRRMPYVGSRESWGAEMHRMYGGIHMSQTREGTKKSVQILAKNYKKRFKKKKAEGGPVKLLRGALLTKGIKHAYKLYKRTGGQKTKKITSDLWRQRHPPASANIAERMKHPDFNALLKHRAKYLVAKDLKKLVKKGATKHARYKDTKKLADYKIKQVMGTVQKAFGVQKAFKKPSKTTLHSTGGPVKLLKGALLTKGIRAGFKIFKKETPQLFSKMKRSRLQLKTDTKKVKTPELIPLGISKIKPDDLRKLTIAQGVKIKVKNQAKIALLHNRKAMPLLWSKAKSLKQVYKLDKYNKPNTQIKIDKFFKEHTKLEKYIDKIKSKSATKHSHGGEVTIGNNVDRSLL